MLDGFLVIDKPAGITSAKALNDVKRRFGRGVKVGHAGTLDPFATGCLVVLVGRATKSSERVMTLPKTYVADVRCGATTETLDPESPEEPGPLIAEPSRAKVEALLSAAAGPMMQKPPAFSAIKVGVRRSYDLARGGQDVDLPAREVQVHAMRLVEMDWPRVRVEMTVGKGFYVRSFARDLAEMLGTTGYLTSLRRTRVGPFDADRATGVVGELLPISLLDGS
ncbi:MAG: tRNA pseudouridine(55) synthase TruB [Planctomycetota bacterium]